MITDPVVQQQMQRMRQSQAEADAYGARAMQSTASSQSPVQGFASGFLSQFDPNSLRGPRSVTNPAQGIQAKTGEGATLASTSAGPGIDAPQGQSIGLNAQNTPFAKGIGAGIQAGLSGAQPSQVAVDYGIGSQQAKKPFQGEKTW
jgi:hypothetical protein